MECTLCPRNCGVDRKISYGYCSSPEEVIVSRADLHMWEEPCISAQEGSGTIFFAGCNLRCVFCQNHEISGIREGQIKGSAVSSERLAQLMLELEGKKANNINLVTGTHYVSQIIKAIDIAKSNGLSIPIVYNTSGYEKAGAIKMLEGYVDIYLPDFKYYDNDIAGKYSNVSDYREVATGALDEMVRQKPKAVFSSNGIMLEGVIVRHLILPGYTKDSKNVVKYLYDRYGDRIYLSIMNQYTPLEGVRNYPEINRRVTKREYDSVVNYAIDLGVENGFIQEGGTVGESFIPKFDFKG